MVTTGVQGYSRDGGCSCAVAAGPWPLPLGGSNVVPSPAHLPDLGLCLPQQGSSPPRPPAGAHSGCCLPPPSPPAREEEPEPSGLPAGQSVCRAGRDQGQRSCTLHDRGCPAAMGGCPRVPLQRGRAHPASDSAAVPTASPTESPSDSGFLVPWVKGTVQCSFSLQLRCHV